MVTRPDSTENLASVPQVDFELLSENLAQLEKRCKASWDNLKVVAKHETKAAVKMTEFLRDCTQRVVILKVVHRRVVNRSEQKPGPESPDPDQRVLTLTGES